MNRKSDFPIFKNNDDLIYFDSAASALKPQPVIEAVTDYYENYSSNIHRGLYPISIKASEKYEEARRIVADFINADPEEVIFTSGTTDGLNFIADSLWRNNLLGENDLVVLTEAEHHANILPWQRIASNLEYLRYKLNEGVDIDSEQSQELLTNAKLISYSLVSNVTGGIVEIKRSDDQQIIVIDAAQAVPHLRIDVKKLECDFLCFSGHKLFGPTGIGVLYINKKWHDKLEPHRVGGGMIREVLRDRAVWDHAPTKFEAGTPPIAEAIGLGAAIQYFGQFDLPQIALEEQNLKNRLILELNKISDIQVFNDKNSIGVVSFSIPKIHPHDIADYLGSKGICLRAGHHCTNILHRDVLCLPATCRVSLSLYNSEGEIFKFIEELKNVIKLYKK